MILLKGFFRKKSTKIYLGLFGILLICITILFSFINYFNKLSNALFSKSAYIVVASKIDYFDLLNKQKSVTAIERALLFNPDYSYDVLGREGYVSRDSSGKLIDSRKSEENLRINWEDFFVGGAGELNESIFVFPSAKLIDDQIVLGLNSEKMQSTDYYKDVNDIISDITGQKIGFKINKNKEEFTIDAVYENYFSEVMISENRFKDLLTNDLYVYRVTINNYKKAVALYEKLSKLEGKNSDSFISINQQEPQLVEGELGSSALEQLITALTYVSYLVLFAFSLIFLIIMRNIIKDESKNNNIERLLGFNKRQVRKYLFLKIGVLIISTCVFSSIISIFLNIIINNKLKFKLIVFDKFLLLTIFGILIFSSLLSCLLFKNKTEKYII